MKSSAAVSLFLGAVLTCATASAARIDMNDPYRAVGREDDVRVDAQLLSEVITQGSPIAVTCQIQNFSSDPIAVAEKVASASYDADTHTITVSLGSEIPPDGEMPRMTTIAPGEKKTFSVATTVSIAMPATRSRAVPTPRFVQIKVNVLRNLAPFRDLFVRQRDARTASVPLNDDQFEQWLEGNETIFLNALPIRYESRRSGFDATQRHTSGSM